MGRPKGSKNKPKTEPEQQPRERYKAKIESRIPTLPSLNVEALLRQADMIRNVYSIDSAYSGIGYVTDHEDFVLITARNGCIKMPIQFARKVLKEALEVLEGME